MSVAIRAVRFGTVKKPFYRLVAIDSRRSNNGKALEVIGYFDPRNESNGLKVRKDRVDYWIGNGASVSGIAKSVLKRAK